MAEGVKPRRYDSPRRRAQAAATRREILDAARRLFEQRGYAAASVAAVAAEANVAVKTVYVTFETKSGILRGLWNRLLRGEHDELPIAQQEVYREVLDEPDPERQLRLNARNSRVAKVRIGAIFEVIHSAARVDPDIEELWGRIQTEHHANQLNVQPPSSAWLPARWSRCASIVASSKRWRAIESGFGAKSSGVWTSPSASGSRATTSRSNSSLPTRSTASSARLRSGTCWRNLSKPRNPYGPGSSSSSIR